MSEYFRQECPSFSVDIFVAGPVADAERICSAFCFEAGLCVSVSATEFIYTGGRESGVRVSFINYPRFPKTPGSMWAQAEELALRLIEDMHQHSASIQSPDKTLWLSRRPQASPPD